MFVRSVRSLVYCRLLNLVRVLIVLCFDGGENLTGKPRQSLIVLVRRKPMIGKPRQSPSAAQSKTLRGNLWQLVTLLTCRVLVPKVRDL